MSERIDIGSPVFELCDLLGLKPDNVRRLDVHIRHVDAEVYKLDDYGAKYVDADTEQAAVETLHFETKADR